MTGTASISSIKKTIQDAEKAIHVERQRVTDEISAYEEFASKVSRISTSSPTWSASTPVNTPVERPQRSNSTLIQALFEDTIMSVPHYEEDYGESIKKHLAEEFSPEIALLLKNDTPITDQHISILRSYTHTAITQREDLAKTLATERDSISNLGSQIVKLSSQVTNISDQEFHTMDFGGLEAIWRRLEVIHSNCDTVAADRQQQIGSRSHILGVSSSDVSLNHYLYQDLDCDYPILNSIGLLGTHIQTLQTNIEQLMSSPKSVQREYKPHEKHAE